MDMDMDKLRSVEDQILAVDDNDSVTMDRATADTLVTIAESVLICEVLADDGELLTAEVLQPTGSSWDELDRLLSAMHVIRWQCCDDNEYNMTKYGETSVDAKAAFSRSYMVSRSARYPHLLRMYDELTELKGRYVKLLSYYDDHRSQLDDKQQDLMMLQRSIMEHYIGVLEARLNYDNQLYSKEDT